MQTIDEMIAVLTAAKEGRKIQARHTDNPTDLWENIANPLWDFGSYDYRAKPEPREWVMVPICGSKNYVTARLFKSGSDAAMHHANADFIHVREVIDEQ